MGSGPRRIVLIRNHDDRAHRTRGLGMRVVGGKIGSDESLFAYVVWTVQGGPADMAGIRQGDKVLEWNGINLRNKTFEEVNAIMDRPGDRVEMYIEPNNDERELEERLSKLNFGSVNPLMDEQIQEQRNTRGGRRQMESSDSEWSSYPSSPTRRRLPRIPVENSGGSSNQYYGELGVKIWYNGHEEQLSVIIIAARNLRQRKSSTESRPEAFVKLRLLPVEILLAIRECVLALLANAHFSKHGIRAVKTAVYLPSNDPQWNKTFIYTDIHQAEVMDKTLEFSVWDKTPDSAQSRFLGEVKIDLENSNLDDHLIWYSLANIKQNSLFSPISSSVPVSPVFNYAQNSSNSRRSFSKSLSDDQGDMFFNDEEPDVPNGVIKSPSMDFQFHRNLHNWQQNEDFGQKLSSTPNLTSSNYLHNDDYNGRTDSSFQRHTEFSYKHRGRNGSLKDQRQVLSDSERGDSHVSPTKKLPQKVKDKVTKTLINRSDNPKRLVTLDRSKKASLYSLYYWLQWVSMGNCTKETGVRASSRSSQSDVVDEQTLSDVSTDDDNVSNDGQEGQENVEVKLGTGQVKPKDFGLDTINGFIQLSIILVKGTLEVDIIRAQKLKTDASGQPHGTYVKTYLRDDGKHSQKRKTRVIRRKQNPNYNQTIRYLGGEAVNKDLVVMVWQKPKQLNHNNKGIGVAQIALSSLRLPTATKDWYLLFPMKSVVCVDNG
ncbi:Protein piccolo [Nymphon striatum]|nr:Protein piccolo [Nymphon striatum]